jgi:hypothetical protein
MRPSIPGHLLDESTPSTSTIRTTRARHGCEWFRRRPRVTAHLLTAKGRPVRRVIAVERDPSGASWLECCEAEGVTLVSPATFSVLFKAAPIVA